MKIDPEPVEPVEPVKEPALLPPDIKTTQAVMIQPGEYSATEVDE